jgi:alpha-L-arabinofuranosidase
MTRIPLGSMWLIAATLVAFVAMSTASSARAAEPVTITVNMDKPGAKINPAMWGAFFEDINFGADGGLYAEMVKNGSFEFPEPLTGWFKIQPSLAKGEVTVVAKEAGKETAGHYAHVVSKAGAPLGVCNVGFRGMGAREGDTYNFTTQIRVLEGSPRLSVEIVGSDGTTLASAPLEARGGEWKQATASLKPNATDANARLTIILQGQGAIDLDRVSLFPQKTWKNRPNGLRADMVQALADLKPGFLRFPGGCIVEGSDLSKRYQWKNTIGPVEDRQLLVNRWNYEFKHRPTPDYFQTFGLGFFEFFQLSEDIGSEPLPILNCGMACQFNSGEVCAPDELKTYIQDALDLIEFANGPATSTWGAKRAAMGHAEPFNMKMLGIGNEQWGPQYIEHLKFFIKELKAKHPEIQLVCAAGPSPQDERYNYLWPQLTEIKADIVDEHCYANPIWFLSNSNRFDKYDRNGPKIFFGEYAAQSVAIVSTKNRNNLECAVSEAAFMTGMERNADVVRMASYAPLFAHIDAWQWTPNLIWVDNLRVAPTPNYYVQQMFAKNRGDVVLPATNDSAVKETLPAGSVAIGATRARAEFKDVQITQGYKELQKQDATTIGGGRWGEKDWRDYTVTLKARRLSGNGNLFITVLDDGAGSRAQWLLGGWENKQHGIQTHFAEQDQLLERVPGSLENNRWYDVKVQLQKGRMDCYLDEKRVQTAEVLHHRVPAVFSSAARDDSTGETILKLVNSGNESSDVTIQLKGVDKVSAGQAIVLAGQLADENTLDKPTTVLPKTMELNGVKPEFNHTLPPRSFSVLRLKTSSPSASK